MGHGAGGKFGEDDYVLFGETKAWGMEQVGNLGRMLMFCLVSDAAAVRVLEFQAVV